MYQCLCCRNETLPVPASDAVAYICPVCWWENDVFLNSPDEPSDENHGMTLLEAQENYIMYQVRNESFSRIDRQARQGRYMATYDQSFLLSHLAEMTDVQKSDDNSFYPAPWKHYSIFTQNQVIDIVSHCEPVLTVGTNDTL